ncbi:DUF3150 domain-containing protein [Ferrimonas kyonanensis]|uniref:DUF3150 domain-containing protein n=1 Tax=Ferrimonas kyonanensis TaxID=364763 RepID=UPI0004200E68|nr:DUF3150 domain-containing protein [Ferrimonas kyonanensis]
MTALNNASANAQSMTNKLPALKEGACLMVVSVNGGCGEAKLPEGKILLDGVQVESAHVKSGTVEWFPTEKLKFVSKASTATSRALNEYGVDLGRCCVLPQDKLEELLLKLGEIESEFNDSVGDLEQSFDTWMADYINANPEIAHYIKALACSKDQFVAKFRYRILPPIAMTLVSEDCGDIKEVKDDISYNLTQELHVYAAKLFSSISGKDKMHRKLLSNYKKMMSKLYSFGFADLKLLKIYDVMDQELNSLPQAGPIDGDALNRMVRWAGVLASEACLELHLSGQDQLAQSPNVTAGSTSSSADSTANQPAKSVPAASTQAPSNANTPLSPAVQQGSFGFSNF